jgi:hypothetical protein
VAGPDPLCEAAGLPPSNPRPDECRPRDRGEHRDPRFSACPKPWQREGRCRGPAEAQWLAPAVLGVSTGAVIGSRSGSPVLGLRAAGGFCRNRAKNQRLDWNCGRCEPLADSRSNGKISLGSISNRRKPTTWLVYSGHF